MFKREERLGKFIGYSYTTDFAYFFFGSRFLPRGSIQGFFPEFRFAFLKQVHGHVVVEGSPDLVPEADAQFTQSKNLALVSQTADCVPILLANADMACAIHSGWKGAAQNIVRATAKVFKRPPEIAAIGPHILSSSFEVGHDVAKQLLAAAPNQEALLLPHPDAQKTYFDLTELVRRQLCDAYGSQIKIEECLEDTRSSMQFHSFRRDKEKAERQYSFVVLKSKKDD